MRHVRRIGIDARELLGEPTGVGRYLGELLHRWTAAEDAASRRLVLYTPEPLALDFPTGSVEMRVIGGGRGTWWEQNQLRRAAREDGLDVFFAPAYTAPLGTGLALGVTIHDISFIAHPEWYRASEGLRRRWLTRRAAALASVIFTDSEFSRSELERYLKIDHQRICVLPPGAPRAAPADAAAAPREPLVLFVGSIFNRRHVPETIAVFAEAARRVPAARLVIVGDNRTWPRQDLAVVARSLGVSDRTELLSYISDAALEALYARAAVFVFLSEYEGFGLTPLEAMAAGVPALVLDTAVAREVYGDAVFYVTLEDQAGAARLLEQLLTDRQRGREVLRHAPAVLGRYSWDDTARRTLQRLERVAVR